MRYHRSAILVSILSLLILDGIYLGYIRSSFWSSLIFKIQGSYPKYRAVPATFAYLVMILVIMTLAVSHVKKDNLFRDSLYWGGLVGLAMYGVFNGTNRAILKNYSMEAFWSDLLWGLFLTITTTYIASYVSYNLSIID